MQPKLLQWLPLRGLWLISMPVASRGMWQRPSHSVAPRIPDSRMAAQIDRRIGKRIDRPEDSKVPDLICIGDLSATRELFSGSDHLRTHDTHQSHDGKLRIMSKMLSKRAVAGVVQLIEKRQ